MSPPGIVNGMARDSVHDNPALVFHALIGNDVCNGHPGMGSMTKPAVPTAENTRTHAPFLRHFLLVRSDVLFELFAKTGSGHT